MKVIDLLNKLANGEVPKKIKYDNDIYEYNKDYQDYGYFNTGIDRYITLIENELNSVFNLNEEVEIIEDTPKEDKKIKKINEKEAIDKIFTYEKGSNLYFLSLFVSSNIVNKINEIIDKTNGEE